MTRVWVISAPLPGHMDWGGLLPTAQALRAQGHELSWVSEEAIRGLVERADLPFTAVDRTGWRWPPPPLPTPTRFVNEDLVTLRFRRALDTWLSEDLVAAGTEALLALADKAGAPDVIVTDPFLGASALAAEALGVPLVVGGWASGPPMDEDEMLYQQRQLGHEAVARLDSLCGRFGLTGVNFAGPLAPSVQSPHLHISYFSAYWHQGETVLPQTEFVGGRVLAPQGSAPDWLAAIPADQPLGLVTLGTTFTGDLDFLARGAQAVAAAGMLPIVVIGYNPILPAQKAQFKASLPPGTHLLNWVDYDHLFPRLAVIVHHGGMGTTHAAIVHAVPQVIAPHAADQRGQARRARQAKVGLEMGFSDVRRGELIPAVQAITTTEWVRAAVDRLAESFASLGGPPHAAELVLEVAAGRRAPVAP